MKDLKALFDTEDGRLSYEEFAEALKSNDIKLVDLNEGNYVSKAKFESELEARAKEIEALNGTVSTRDTDLEAISKGKHPIPSSTLVASVEDSENSPLDKRNTESHKKKIDFMVVVKGTEGFALLDHASSTISVPYDNKKDVMRYQYDKNKTHFFHVKSGQFVIFFPSDWHIAKVQTKKKDQREKP